MAGAREGSFANHREPLATCLTTRFCGTLMRGFQKTRTTQTGESTHKTDISRQKGQTKPCRRVGPGCSVNHSCFGTWHQTYFKVYDP